MKTKTTLIIAALAVILGVAFAVWTEQATIQINAKTGYIDLDFTQVTYTCSSYMKCDYTGLTGSDSGNDGPPSVTLTLDNAYPRAEATFNIRVYNDGTIPVTLSCDVNAPSELSVNVSAPSSLDSQNSGTITVKITVGDGAQEQQTYSATVSCTYTQAVP